MPLLHHNHLHRALTITAFNSTATNDNFTTSVLYKPLEGVERLENYRPGGYHPIEIGDQFHGRYRAIHKLGYGSYSTTWLVRDEHCSKYVAMKVCTADSNPKEVDIIYIISTLTGPHSSPINTPGKTMIPSILDRLTIHGPNGHHACYVTAPARASLSGVKDGSWIRLFQLDVARSLAAQLVLVVDYVHTQGIVHGDLHLGNILLKVPHNFDQLSVEQLYEKYGEPEVDPVVHLDGNPLPPGVPSHGIAPIWLGEASEEITLAEARILLTDFGEAFSYPKELKYESRTPLVIPPPEARFEPNKPLSFSSDIWSLACTIWTIIAQRPLFEGFLATEDDMTCEHVDTLGTLLPEWWKTWEARQHKFAEDGTPLNRNPFRSWGDRFEDSVQQPRQDSGMPLFDARERDAIFDMLRPMLSFRPEDRPTTKQVLESEWMVKWALPEYGRIKGIQDCV
ncbi:serine/threonine-protein kinase SRPK [Aspergillus udagawae]|uniref:non-specific serine/threonine protein kinase n=1 Tax=Aspergillus udagawae TaxID=91492 RepID=A0ABQ1ASF7_9EURO|nr:serine/threonine-protein kinase SRPK [Aspergillus udagawae]GFF87282.1 serine/threonine-protein kinase SRPK [Aspergillus udagawae]GFG15886.1 serine/threonine-protein kinase SRPK [Aspergillus udagawae]